MELKAEIHSCSVLEATHSSHAFEGTSETKENNLCCTCGYCLAYLRHVQSVVLIVSKKNKSPRLIFYHATCRFLKKETYALISSFLASLALIISVSHNYNGQAITTEIISLLPLPLLLYLTFQEKKTTKNFFYIGLCIALAAMFRLNLAYLGIIFGLFIAWEILNKREKVPLPLPLWQLKFELKSF